MSARLACLLALCSLSAVQEPVPPRDPASPPSDPAPPAVRALPPLAPPEARATKELTFHAAPRALAAGAVSEDWPMLLGPRRDGHTRETGLAKSWPKDGPPLVWEFAAGSGYASPVIAEGKLVFTHRVEDEVHVDCLEPETGKRFWRFSFPCAYNDRYVANDGPRSTPSIAGALEGFPACVYLHGVEGQLFCLELATGRVIWQRDTAKEFAIAQDFFGLVASPLVRGELLILNLGAPSGPCVAAFDRRTGKLAWGTSPKAGNWGASCASPVLGTLGGRERLFVVAGGDSRPPTGGLLVLDPASGALEFEYPHRSKTYESVNGACPVVAGKSLFLTAAYNTGSACLAARADGGFDVLWSTKHLGLQFSTPIYEQGVLWAIDGVHDRAGALVVLDPATGAELSRTDLDWEEELEEHSGCGGSGGSGEKQKLSFTVGEGSLLWADGKLLCLGDNGHLLWLEPKKEGASVLARAWLFGANESWTPPVVWHGLLFVRQTKAARFGDTKPRLLCYDLRAAG